MTCTHLYNWRAEGDTKLMVGLDCFLDRHIQSHSAVAKIKYNHCFVGLPGADCAWRVHIRARPLLS